MVSGLLMFHRQEKYQKLSVLNVIVTDEFSNEKHSVYVKPFCDE